MNALLIALLLAQYTPKEAQSLFMEGNDAYYRGDFPAAQERYEKLLQAGLGGPDVLFNLGTAHLAAGELGLAVLYLERAHRQSDENDVSANLAIARQRQVDQVVGEEAEVPFAQRLAGAMDERLVVVGFLVSWWLGFGLLWLTWRRKPGSRLILALATALLLLVSSGLGSALWVYAHVRATVIEAVVIPSVAQVREFPGDAAKVSFEVHAGLKLRIMETSGRYVRVRLPNALEGWTEKEGLVAL